MLSQLTCPLKSSTCIVTVLSSDADGCDSLGVIDASTVAKVVKEVTDEQKARQAAWEARPPLENVLNMHDFEIIAKAVIPEKAWVSSRCFSTLYFVH